MNSVTDVFSRIDGLASAQRKPGEIYPVFMGRCLAAKDEASLKNILTFKNMVAKKMNSGEVDKAVGDDICLKLDMLHDYLTKYYSSWVLSDEFEKCKSCSDVFAVLQKLEAKAEQNAAADSVWGSVVEMLEAAGDSSVCEDASAFLNSAKYEDGVLKSRPSCYLSGLRDFSDTYTEPFSVEGVSWDYSTPMRMYYIGPGHSVGTLIAESQALAGTQKSNQLNYDRLVFLKAVLGKKVIKEGYLCVLPAGARGSVKITCDGKVNNIYLKKFQCKPTSDLEKDFIEGPLRTLSEFWGTTKIRNKKVM